MDVRQGNVMLSWLLNTYGDAVEKRIEWLSYEEMSSGMKCQWEVKQLSSADDAALTIYSSRKTENKYGRTKI